MSQKKKYVKPTVQMESFVMDIAIATDDFNMLDLYKNLFFQEKNREPYNDAEFQTWLATNHYGDNNTSQWCYFTAVTPS